jgi:hypothetical protein
LPYQWYAPLGETIDNTLRLHGGQGMKNPNEFGHNPIRHGEDSDRIHVIGIHVSPSVANPTIVANLVQRW